MDLLLDTCTFLWIVSGDAALSDHAAALFRDPANDVFLSSISAWEISIKCRLGKLTLPDSPAEYVPEQRQRHGIEPLALGESAALLAANLPDVHRDPFDRMLVCQAMATGAVLLSPDRAFRSYPVRVAW